MAHAEKCPVCNGHGQIEQLPNKDDSTNMKNNFVTCHGCNGTGWVTVKDDDGNWTYPSPVPYYPPPYQPIYPWYQITCCNKS